MGFDTIEINLVFFQGDQLFPLEAVQSSTHNCSVTEEVCGPANLCIDSDLNTFCHTAPNVDTAPWFALMFSDSVTVTDIELEISRGKRDRVGNVEVRITNCLPTDGNTKFTGGELFSNFSGPDTPGRFVSLSNKPTQGRFVLVQRDQGEYPNNVLIMEDIRVFGPSG